MVRASAGRRRSESVFINGLKGGKDGLVDCLYSVPQQDRPMGVGCASLVGGRVCVGHTPVILM